MTQTETDTAVNPATGEITATFPQIDFAAVIQGAVLRSASNGLTYQLKFELPVWAHQAIVQMANAITLAWGGEDVQLEPRLIGSAELKSSKTAPDADGQLRHVAVYQLPQSEVLTGIATIAACLAQDVTKGRLYIRSEQAQFDLTRKA